MSKVGRLVRRAVGSLHPATSLTGALGVPLILLTVLASPSGGTGCAIGFSGTTLTITCIGTGPPPTISRDTSGNILFDGAAILGGPTVTTTDLIEVNGSSSVPVSVVIDESNGTFGPGATSEATGISEIEFDVSLASSADSLTVIGTPGNDLLLAQSNGINLNADADIDVTLTSVETLGLTGGDGNDVINAGGTSIPLVLLGGNGNDSLTPNSAVDQSNGDAGDDVIFGSAGADSLDGGLGVDTVDYRSSSAAVSVTLPSTASGGHAQGDTILGFENVTGSAFPDTLTGDGGPNVIQGVGGGDTMAGQGSVDTLSYLFSPSGVNVIINTNTASGGDAAGDNATGFESLRGSRFADVLTGDGNANVINGGLGADSLDGAGGVDPLDYSTSVLSVSVNLATGVVGGPGEASGDIIAGFENLIGSPAADSLTGNGGPNTIRGGGGGDQLTGGAGRDTLDYVGSTAGVTVNLKTGSAAGGDATGDAINTFENVTGTSFHDVLTGTDGNNTLKGVGGKDTLDGLLGTDTLNGGAGVDTCLNGETLVSCEM
jgi:Ca2+-binding RTX toxin-like protein